MWQTRHRGKQDIVKQDIEANKTTAITSTSSETQRQNDNHDNKQNDTSIIAKVTTDKDNMAAKS
jgi:hypothetical protein